VQVARPYVRSLRPAAENLARATPDFTSSFHELNRFFNMAAYNPGGKEGLTGNPQQDANRNEGYLYWVAWLGQVTDSIFSTSDANGSFRRASLGFDCATIKSQVVQDPTGGLITGGINALNNTALCGGDNSNQSFIPSVPGLPPLPPIPKTKAAKATGGGH